MLRFVALGLVAAACGCLAATVLSSTACITAPPPELPAVVGHRPTIVHDAVVPPSNVILIALPTEFVVPVELDDPNESFQWDIFVDYNPCADPSTCAPSQPVGGVHSVTPTPGTLDGGVEPVAFTAPTDLTPSQCHRIDFLVAHFFDPSSAHTWDSVGGDIVTWFYNPGGSPAGCPLYDAGAVQDGAFPPADAGAEALPIVPESGTGDP